MGQKIKKRVGDKNLLGKTFFATAVAAAFIMALPSYATAEVSDRIVANVNGEIILLSDIREQVSWLKSIGASGEANIPESALSELNVLRKIVDEKILAHYAKENNVSVKESDIDKAVERVKESNGFTEQTLKKVLANEGMTIEKYREKLRDQMLIQRIIQIEVGQVKVSDDEVENFYRKNKEKFTEPGRVRASHIVLLVSEDEETGRADEVKKKAVEILEKIKAGADFSEMARLHSQDGAAQNGGDLGWFTRGKMLPVFERTSFAMKKGEVGGPVRSKLGYHIIKVVDREHARPVALEKVAANIKRRVGAEAHSRKRAAWMERLRAQAYIEILY